MQSAGDLSVCRSVAILLPFAFGAAFCLVVKSLAHTTSHRIMPFRKQRAQPPIIHERLDDDVEALPISTRWHREHGRSTRRDKAAREQYLTPQEEKGLAHYVQRMCQNGYPLPVKVLRSLALVIRQRRRKTPEEAIKPAGKNWPQGFYKRNQGLKARRMRAIPWDRHDHTIYPKVAEWFSVIGKELVHPAILAENVYNMDETGVLLSKLGSLKVLVGKNELRNYRGAGSQRTLITAVECISASGKCLDPLVIWPAATHRSNWTTHPTPGWHFACTETGYTNNAITLYWMQHVFDPQTKSAANGKPRILISDGLASHESLDVMTFCFENDIILCRLPSHTSHKLQHCDVAVFGPLKTAYREQVERLFRGGAGTIGKQHFTLLYSRAREIALTARNIRSGWSKAGLFPLNPDRVLGSLDPPSLPPSQVCPEMTAALDHNVVHVPLSTPTSANGPSRMRGTLDEILDSMSNDEYKLYIQKVVNAAEQTFANCALLADENQSLIQQNNEKKVRQAVKATIPGPAKIMSYEDIVRAQKARDENEAKSRRHKRTRGRKRTGGWPAAAGSETRTEAIEIGESLEQGENLVQVSEEQYVGDLLLPCPGRAPVARMW